ncbi:MAG: glycosyltransferase family 4 protein [Candidatus Pacearchaeota archaeon]
MVKRTVVHGTVYEFPLDRCFFGQTFVIGDHVRHSRYNTAVVSHSKHNIEDLTLADLQVRVARDKFSTELVFMPDLKSAEPRRAYDVSRSPLFPFLEERLKDGPVGMDLHYFNNQGKYPELDQVKDRFGDDVPFFLHLHCLASLYFGDLNLSKLTQKQTHLRDNLWKLLEKHKPRLIAVSDAVRDSFYQHGIVPNGAIEVVHNGIETDLYRKASAREKEEFRRELGVSANRLVGYAGRLERAKGADTLFGILQAHERSDEDVAFVIATANGYQMGEFIARAKTDLPNLIRSNRLKFCIDASKLTAGFYTRDSDVCQHFGALADEFGLTRAPGFSDLVTRPVHPHLDVYIQPSTSEALGLSVVEASMSEVPVVASDVGGIPEVVNANVGSLIPIRDRALPDVVDGFVEGIKYHLDHPLDPTVTAANRASLIRMGFDSRSMAANLDDIYSGKK